MLSNGDTYSHGHADRVIVKSEIVLLCQKKVGIGNYTGPAQSLPNTEYFHQIHFNSTLPCTSVSLQFSLHALGLKFCSSFSLGILLAQFDSYFIKYNEARHKEIGNMERQYVKSAKNTVVVAIYNLFIPDLLNIPSTVNITLYSVE